MGTPPWPANAAPATIGVAGTGSVDLTWTVPSGALVKLESVWADITTDADPVTAMIEIADQSGVVIARKRQTETIDEFVAGSATWALRLADDRRAVQRIESPDGTIVVTDPEGPTVGIDVALPVSSLPRIRATNTSAVTFGSGVPATVTLTSALTVVGDWTGDAAYPSTLTVPEDGFYAVNATIRWFTEADTAFRSILLNVGGSFEGGAQGPKQSGATLAQSATCLRFLTTGTTISLTGISAAVGNVRIDAPNLAVARIQ